MDKNSISSKLNKNLPGAILETRLFGRSTALSVWVEISSIQKVAQFLKSDPDFKFDWLENFSVVEFDSAYVLSYFIRSTTKGHYFVLRVSSLHQSNHKELSFPSIREIWKMGDPFEREAEEMFGIRFKLESSQSQEPCFPFKKLPDEWKGFPQRKGYVFPEEFFNVPHVKKNDKKRK